MSKNTDSRSTAPRRATAPKSSAATAQAPRKRARRLDPEVRRKLILDAAGKLVQERGASNCTLDEVAIASNVSKPLVYKYFPSRGALLGALLQREFDHIRGRQANVVDPDAPFDELQRVHVRRYLEYIMERGALMRALIHDAGVTEQVHRTAHTQQKAITEFWVTKAMETFGLPRELARMGMIMAITGMEGAEGSLRLGKVELDRAADFWTTFILAGWDAVGQKFGRRMTD